MKKVKYKFSRLEKPKLKLKVTPSEKMRKESREVYFR